LPYLRPYSRIFSRTVPSWISEPTYTVRVTVIQTPRISRKLYGRNRNTVRCAALIMVGTDFPVRSLSPVIYQRVTTIYPQGIVGNRPLYHRELCDSFTEHICLGYTSYSYCIRAIPYTIQSDTNGLHYSNSEKGLPVAGSVQLADPAGIEN
jgi:hypothetical protein